MTVADFDARLVAALPMLGRYARKLCGQRADADDLVQAAALQMLERRGRFTPGENAQASFRGWAARVLHNHFVSDRRRQKTRRFVAGATLIYGPISAPADQDRRVEARQMLGAFHGLPLADRAILVRKRLWGQTQEDIARQDGVPLGTIKARVARAAARLEAVAS